VGLGITLLAFSGPLPSRPDPELPGGLHIAPHERVEISIPSLNIPSGLYGPQQAQELWDRLRDRENPGLGRVEEIPLPNVPGKFKFYLVELRLSARVIWLRAILKKWGDAWALQSVREVQRF
jgi:hypothetical protein